MSDVKVHCTIYILHQYKKYGRTEHRKQNRIAKGR